MKSFYIVVCSALVQFSLAFIFTNDECEGNEIYYNGTGSICHATCDDPDHDDCFKILHPPGCYCKRPFVDFGGDCIMPDKCPPTGTCPKNELYLKRGCDSFCDGPYVTQCNTEFDFPSCYCQKPFSRNKRGKCLKREECPKTNSSIKKTRAPRRTPARSSRE
ncbi:hypothetical protein QR680_015500 [Steinernema hermaphroditum]|uniref:TIL domain-containing protein n=1 Tax=Steinernema hermaphroditum TaxID=289476 RepID=A0AA39H8Z4_9BILA|nr:hypothetical protein QR680_015500 [Steinernema hermaphroditum]